MPTEPTDRAAAPSGDPSSSERPAGSDRLAVPGAQLHYQVSGSGPALLLIPGGPADGGVFDRVIPVLSRTRTVISYDPRGISRSSVLDPAADIEVATQADDARRLLLAVGAGRALVFGSSGGAVTALQLAARHPALVHTVIAHEPPMLPVLSAAEQRQSGLDDVLERYRQAGPGAALARFLAVTGMAVEDEPEQPVEASAHDPATLTALIRMQSNLELFFEHMMRAIIGYRLDVTALRDGGTRIVIGRGRDSVGQLAYRTATATAALLAAPVQDFAGGHGTFANDPAAFGALLDRIQAG